MKTNLMLTIALMSLGSAMATEPVKDNSAKPILEMVVYKINPAAAGDINKLIEKNAQLLMKLEGFVSYKSTKSLSDPLTRVDYCEWQTVEHATKAAEAVQSMKEFEAFNQSIAEIIYFGHLENF